ncbi:MAG: hypothetical protein IBJ02_02480 [Brevundimonas sp.]|nr:hypothetical protein [Brevundimonas sp.]
MNGISMPTDRDLEPSGLQPKERKVWLRWAVLCDGQRREDNGKRLLLGVYDHTVVSARKPAFLVPRLVGAFELLRGGEHTLHFRVAGPNGTGVGNITTASESEPGSYIDFEVPVAVLASEPGEIRLDWRVDDDPWGPPMVWQISFTESPEEIPAEQVQVLASQFEAASEMKVKIGGHAAVVQVTDED